MKDSSGKRSEECLAYRWWNSQIPNVKNLNQPPEVVLPNDAHEIWSKICPLFLLFVLDEQDVQVYWESIQTIVNMFVGDQVTVPNPISKFPDFIKVVYSSQEILIPKTVDYCVYFIKKFGFHDAAHFFLYQSPVFFLDPILYLETLLELRYLHYFLWEDFVKKPLLVDAFFEMYLNFFLPIPQESDSETEAELTAYKHRNLLCEVFFSLIQDSYNHHPNITPLVTKFLDNSINIATSSSSDRLFPVFRSIFSAIDFADSHNILPKSELQNRSLQLFEGTLESPSIYLTFRFLFHKQYLTSAQILSIISHHSVTSLDHLTILMEITDQAITVPLLLLLLRTALRRRVWHRTCFSLMRRCLAKFSPARQDVRELVQVVVRRLFLWLSFASLRHKYSGRSLMLCESMVLLYESRIGWLQQCILSAAVSLTSASKPVPVYFRSFFPSGGAAIDDAVLHEWELFAASAKLKTFPFDSSYGKLIMPPGKDAAIGRSFFSQQCQAVQGQPAGALISHQKSPLNSSPGRIRVHQAEARKSASSSLAVRAQLPPAQNDVAQAMKAKARPANTISSSQSFARAKKAAQGPIIIKRPESSVRMNKSQSEIKIHPKRKDALLS